MWRPSWLRNRLPLSSYCCFEIWNSHDEIQKTHFCFPCLLNRSLLLCRSQTDLPWISYASAQIPSAYSWQHCQTQGAFLQLRGISTRSELTMVMQGAACIIVFLWVRLWMTSVICLTIFYSKCSCCLSSEQQEPAWCHPSNDGSHCLEGWKPTQKHWKVQYGKGTKPVKFLRGTPLLFSPIPWCNTK